MISAPHRQKGFIAALLHRISGVALAIFLPIHFLALGTALNGAGALDTFFAATNHAAVKLAELGLVVALATHMTLGLRVLAVELLDWRERSLTVLSMCFAAAFGVGLIFLLNLR